MVHRESHKHYFQEAGIVAARALCTRAKCGAIIVAQDGQIIGTGYNAPPNDDESQRMCNKQFDGTRKPKSDKTCCVHAEWNAIMDALKNHGKKVSGATLYFMRVDEHNSVTNAGAPYCTVCSRLALQSGLKSFGLWEAGPNMIPTDRYNRLSYDFYL